MAERVLAMPTESEVTEQIATYGGAFGTGVILGWVATTRPAWATGVTLLAGAAGAAGALMLKGLPSQMLEGVGAAAMGALGASLPGILAGGGVAKKVAAPPNNGVKLLPAPTNVVAEAISRQVKSAVEI